VTVADRPKHYELIEGERVLGTVIQLPRAGGHLGTFLTVHTSTGLIAIAANPKRGATVLGRELERLQVRVGDQIWCSGQFGGERLRGSGMTMPVQLR
jgi:hypothetical protein